MGGAVGIATVLAASSGAAPPLRGVNFISVCGFSHRGTDDPIVLPRQPGFSHDHTFIGNTSTDAFSTPARCAPPSTTCKRAGDHAAYWTPTLFVGGEAVVPTTAIAYYRRNTTAPVKPFPAGLQMVAGNSKLDRAPAADGHLVGLRRARQRPAHRDRAAVPGRNLSLHVNFPDCWDGKTLAYNNQKNTAYSVNGRCPKGYPVALPAISLTVRYPVTTTTKPVELSSGGQYSGHADFINTWDQAALAALVRKCLNAYRHCGVRS